MVSVEDGRGRVSEPLSDYFSDFGGGWNVGESHQGTGPDAGGDFAEEFEATRWIARAIQSGEPLPIDEAQAVVRSLVVALHQEREVLHPLYRLGSTGGASVHSMGVSILTMTFAEHLGMRSKEVKAAGIAALLHDVGLAMVPDEILQKKEELTSDEVLQYQNHTLQGARILLEAKDDLSLAAVVAYEHHMAPDGSGYPAMRHPREMNEVSRMVAICGSYHARRSIKPFRPATEPEVVLSQMESNAGRRYDRDLCIEFVAMMREMEERADRIRRG